jgi:hypothetical protein
MDQLWEQYKRLLKVGGVVALLGDEPFSSKLRLSNPKWYRYDWYWTKNNATGFLNANRMPLKRVETISIFYPKLPLYNPQKEIGYKPYTSMTGYKTKNYGKFKSIKTVNDGKRGLNWTEEDDVKLVNYFNDLTQAGVKTAMSNVLSHRGKENKVLAEFIKANPDLKVIHFNMDYSNSTYHTKSGKSDEILIKNY